MPTSEPLSILPLQVVQLPLCARTGRSSSPTTAAETRSPITYQVVAKNNGPRDKRGPLRQEVVYFSYAVYGYAAYETSQPPAKC